MPQVLPAFCFIGLIHKGPIGMEPYLDIELAGDAWGTWCVSYCKTLLIQSSTIYWKSVAFRNVWSTFDMRHFIFASSVNSTFFVFSYMYILICFIKPKSTHTTYNNMTSLCDITWLWFELGIRINAIWVCGITPGNWGAFKNRLSKNPFCEYVQKEKLSYDNRKLGKKKST